MPKKKRGAGWSKGHDDRKHGNKDTKYEERKVAEWQAKLDAKHGRSGTSGTSPQSAQTSRTRAATADDDESDESEDTASAAEKRVTIKYFYVHLFEDLDHAVLQNIIRTSSLPQGDRGRYDNGTPKELASAMVRTWEHHPTSARIVEDMTRLPLVLDKIIEAKGGLVPDFEMQHGGCSKRKRSLKGADSAALRSYQPSAEVAAVAEKRRKELRQKAEEMSGN